MNKEKTLRDISYETKKVNNNLQRLCNIGLLGIFFKILKDAKEDGNARAETRRSRTGCKSSEIEN